MMPSIDRPLSGDVMRFNLNEEHQHASDAALLEQHGRTARTLMKEGPLRVTLIALAAGGEMAEHSVDGPIAIHILHGSFRFIAPGEAHDLGAGDLLTLRPGIRHSVSSDDGGSFLLTVMLPQ